MKKLIPVFLVFMLSCKGKNESNKITKTLDEYFTAQLHLYHFNGNVLVAEKGKIIFQKSYGFADYKKERLLNDSSVFELASVSKQFTATAILLLKDRGKLKLTDSLRYYFPELPYYNISLQQMLTHVSGLPDYESAMTGKWNPDKVAFNADMIAFLANEKPPVYFAPGAKWLYSNTAYAILASIVEKVSGQTFAAFLAKNIFEPLSMTHSRVFNTRRSTSDTIANYAYGYVFDDKQKKYVLPDSVPDLRFVYYLDGIQGDGIVNSTTGDLLKWDRAIKNHSILSEESQKAMITGQSIIDTARNYRYGYGLFVEKNELGNIISHSGGWPGYATMLTRNIDKDFTIIILSNNESHTGGMSIAVQHILAGNPVVMPTTHKAILLDSNALEAFTGVYKANSELTIERRGTQLFRILPNGAATALSPESSTHFFYDDGSDRQIQFEMDSNNKVRKAWVIAFGVKTELIKIK